MSDESPSDGPRELDQSKGDDVHEHDDENTLAIERVPAISGVTNSKKLAIAPGRAYSDATTGSYESFDHALDRSPLEIAPSRPHAEAREEREEFVDIEFGPALEGTEDLVHFFTRVLQTGGPCRVSSPAMDSEQAPTTEGPLVSAEPVREMALVAASPVLLEEEPESESPDGPNCWTRRRNRYLVLTLFLLLVSGLVIALIFVLRPAQEGASPYSRPFSRSRNRIEMVLEGSGLMANLAGWQDVTSAHVLSYWNEEDSAEIELDEVVTRLRGLQVVQDDGCPPGLRFSYSQSISGTMDAKPPRTTDYLFTRPFNLASQDYISSLREVLGAADDIGFRSIRVVRN